jgi:class 3 adenylate cyclase/tetratricopeptide (TPR) repeat protein
MQCLQCQIDNPENAKFCNECGRKLELVCTNCNKANPPGSKFCNACGQNLNGLRRPPALDYTKPQSYTPKYLADKILTSRSSIEGERKLVTVLFADVANYTSMAEKLDPEEVHQIMNSCFKILMDEIHKYEGTINQFTGDGVMALFGAPVAHEDHAQRACHAALSIQKAIEDYETEVHKDYGADFKMRLGLNSGPVIVGSIGDDLRMDYTAVGDTTNLASRIESIAGPGTTFVSKHAHRLARDFFEFKAQGKVRVKGKAEPQEVFKLIKVSGVDTRIAASVAKGLSRFVGRKSSMGSLMDAYNKARSGSGQVVEVVGDAGVGKSRLLLEFNNRLPPGEFTYLEGQCLHFGNAMAYLPVLDILRSYFKIKEGDQESRIKKYMEEKILQLDEELHGTLPSFHELLSLGIEDATYQKLEPQQKREKTFESLRDLFVCESRNRPIILVVEDLHWIDKTSEEFFNYLVEWLANTHILLIFLYRPEYTPPWGGKSYYSQIGLSQLTSQSSAELIQAILYDCDIEPGLETLIHNRSAGTPLYIEELTHSLLENGSIQREQNQCFLSIEPKDIQIPDTIQGIIAARMDRLEDNTKRTMQVASVIGRDFAFRVLQTITGMKKELNSHLLNLKGLEFIYEKRLSPELEYIFKHALTQEVAYNSLLLKRRKEIHGKIGKAVEGLYPERLEEFCEMLAYHFDQGQVWDKAVVYQVKAGVKTRQSFALQLAFQYFNRAKEILEKNSPEVPWQVRYDLFFGRGQILGEMGQWPLACQDAKTAVKIAHREGSRGRLMKALFAGAFAAFFGHLIDDLKAMLAALEPIVADDPESLLGAAALQTMVNFISDDIPAALAGEKNVDELIRLAPNSPFLMPASMWKGFFHRWRGDFKKCSQIFERMLPRIKEAAPATVYLQSLFFYGLAIGEQGFYQKAIRILKEGRQHGLEAGERYSTPKVTNSLGWVYHELCLFDKAIEYNNLSLDSFKELLGPHTSNLFEIESQTRVNLGENYLMKGELQQALEYFEMVYQNVSKPEYFFVRWRWKPRCLIGLGELWFQNGDLSKAQSYLDETLNHGWTPKFPYKKYLVRSGRLQGNIYAAQGKFNEAKTQLQQTLKWAQQLGNPTQLWKIHQALGTLYHNHGHALESIKYYHKALGVVQNMAAGLSESELKEGFLQSAPIQELFAQTGKG